MFVKMLNPIHGYEIEKSADLDSNGKIKKETTVYSVYSPNDHDFPVDCFQSLKEAKECVMKMRRCE